MKFSSKYPEASTLRSISSKNPYTALVVETGKDVKPFYNPYRGWVLICADTASYNRRLIKEISWHNSDRVFQIERESPISKARGQAVAVAFLQDVRPMKENDVYSVCRPFKKSFIYSFVNIHPIEPIPILGNRFLEDCSHLIQEIELLNSTSLQV